MSDGLLKANQHLSEGWRYARKEVERLHGIIQACPTCRRHLVRTPHLALPEWATGEAWAGWQWSPRTQAMLRWSRGTLFEITDDAELILGRMYDDWQRPSVIEGIAQEAARRAADVVAEADGGWSTGLGFEDEGIETAVAP